MSIYEDYLKAKEEADAAKKNLEQMQVKLYEQFQKDLNQIGDTSTFTYEDENEGFKVSITKKESVKVDQKLASVVDIGFRKKYELDKKEYKNLSDNDKRRVDECITTKPGKPGFKVERI